MSKERINELQRKLKDNIGKATLFAERNTIRNSNGQVIITKDELLSAKNRLSNRNLTEITEENKSKYYQSSQNDLEDSKSYIKRANDIVTEDTARDILKEISNKPSDKSIENGKKLLDYFNINKS